MKGTIAASAPPSAASVWRCSRLLARLRELEVGLGVPCRREYARHLAKGVAWVTKESRSLGSWSVLILAALLCGYTGLARAQVNHPATQAEPSDDPHGTEIQPEPVTDTSEYRGYVAKATIETVTPQRLKPNARVAVDVSVWLARPIPVSDLSRTLDILIDGVALERADAPTDSESDHVSRQRSGAQLHARPEPGALGITLFATTPSDLPSSQDVTLSVFSRLDGRNVAIVTVGTAESPTGILKYLDGKALTRLIIVAVSVSGALFVFFVWWRSRQQIAQLQAQVEAGRTRLNEFAQTAALERTAASAEEMREHTAASAEEMLEQASPEVPTEIIQAIANTELTIVLGPGASAQAGMPNTVPLWLAVVDRVQSNIHRSRIPQLRELVGRSETSIATELLISLIGRERLSKVLALELAPTLAAPKRLHEQLLKLAQLGVKRFVDLTWDNTLESALESEQPRVFTSTRHEGLSESLRSGQVTLLKPIGSVTEPQGMCLTQQEFRRRLAHAPELERSLSSLFSTQTLLFIGLGTKGIEEFITSLPPELEGSGRRHFAVVPFDRSIELWGEGPGKRFGVNVLPYAARDLEALPDFLQELVSRAQQNNALDHGIEKRIGSLSRGGKLQSLTLRNIGNFKTIEISFDENWNLLLGDNGGGKSTILRAITLALSGSDSRGEGMAARLLRNGEQEGSIELTFGSSRVRTTLVRDGTRVQMRSLHITPLQAGQVLVLAFPALRGVTTTQPTGPTRMEAADPSVDDVAPLLQEKVDTRLNQLKQWVINTAIQSENSPNGREARMFSTFKDVIRDIVPGRHVELRRVDRQTWTVWLNTDDGEVSFDSLSQGTSSILGWVGVLLQRLYDVYPSLDKPEEGSALVIIDEIDAHLHPRWQRKLVTLTREKFPNVQMVASSHSPLLAGAMRRNELRIVERDPETDEMRAAPPREDLSGQKADAILTSSLFALPTSRSPEAEKKINEYFALFHKPGKTSAETVRLRSLEEELEHLNYGTAQVLLQTQEKIQRDFAATVDAIPAELVASLSERLTARGRSDEGENL